MKKALIVFLILAVAGGLFAQITWGGGVSTGFGVGFDDNDDSKPLVDYIRNRGEHGMRFDFTGNYAGAKEGYGTYGATLTLRGQVARFTDGETFAFSFDGGRAWWQPNSLLRFDVGDGGPGGFGTPGAIDTSMDVAGGNGLNIRLTPPVTGLTLVGTAFYGKAYKLFEDMSYGFGVKYEAANLILVVGDLVYNPAVAAKIRIAAGANYLGLSGLGLSKIAADVRTNNLGESNSFIDIGEVVTFGKDALTLTAKARQALWLGDGTPEVSIPMYLQGEVSYKITPEVTAGIEGRYTMGYIPDYNYRNAQEMGVPGESAFSGKDKSGLGISPQITFNVGPEIKLGYNLQMDMSKDKPSTTTGKTMQHLIYGTVNFSF
jgi:hypothetical protein